MGGRAFQIRITGNLEQDQRLLIYGIGGILVPFVGIKIIDMLLVLLGLA